MSYRTYHEVEGDDRSRLGDQVADQRNRVADRLASIQQVVAVMSGKGGVGKSYVSSLLAVAASAEGRSVGVLDADLNSPTVGRLLHSGALEMTDVALLPAVGDLGVKVVSSDFILDEDTPLRWKSAASSEEFVWRGALEVGMLREFLADVEWGALDLLIVDLPPGADAAKDLMMLVPSVAAGFAVTIPTEESRRSVARAIRAAREAGMPIGGIIENMSCFREPKPTSRARSLRGLQERRLRKSSASPCWTGFHSGPIGPPSRLSITVKPCSNGSFGCSHEVSLH